LLSFLGYFTVAPRFPDWRDSGLADVAVAWAGVLLSWFGWRRARGRRRRGALGAGLFGLGFTSALVLAVYVLFLSYQLPSAASAPGPGDPAPGFRLPDQDGRQKCLQDFAGRWLVLDFFRGHW
jgi:hypothetical protein